MGVIVSLLQEIHSRFLTTDHVDENISAPVKQGLENLWHCIRQPETLSKLLDSLLVFHANKLNGDLKQLAADLVIQSIKPSILTHQPSPASSSQSGDTSRQALALVASEAVAAFNNVTKEGRKLRVHLEESVSVLPCFFSFPVIH